MYNRSAIVDKDSVRVKLFMTKNRLDDHSNHSDAYIRIFNRSLRTKYAWWLIVEKSIRRFFENVFGEERCIVRGVAFVGRCGMRVGSKLVTWKREIYGLFHSRSR